MRLFTVVVLGMGLALVVGCAAAQEQWARDTFKGVRYDDAFQVVRDILDRDYTLAGADPVEGRIETRWSNASLSPYYRFSTRERVVARVERVDGSPGVGIRVVRQKAVTRNPMRTVPEDEWEDDEDDPIRAQILLKAVQVVLGEFGVSDEFRKRMEGSPPGAPEGGDG